MNREQFKEALSKLVLQFFESMTSAKFYILLSSSAFFWFGKLDQSNWLIAVLTVAGLKETVNVAGILKGFPSKEVKNETKS